MYKDKDKQREAIREATRRYRGKKGDSALSGPKDGLKNARGLPVVGKVGDTHPVIPERGKDIKCFADLPPDVQMTIDSMSLVDGKIDQTIKANRTAIAINYQHQFPDQYYPHNTLSLRPVGRVGDSVSEWMKANNDQ